MLFFLKKEKIFRLVSVIILVLAVIYFIMFPLLTKKFFPLKYREEITRYATANSLDPLLVMAIINVESKFNPRAVSKSGARGLMQLMPETAAWASAKMRLPYREELLYNPEYNIKVGCWYLANLHKQFEGRLPVILAAYNGGRGNVKQWLKTGKWSGNYSQLESIPFKETRDFVKKVQFNYVVYRWLYKNKVSVS